jgi:predicted RND superfamily exporter protein
MLIEFYDDTLHVNRTTISDLTTTVEAVMDTNSPYGYRIGYHAPGQMGNSFATANDADLNLVITNLFQVVDSEGTSVYEEIVSSELEQVGGQWHASVMMIFIAVDNDLLEQNFTFDSGEANGKKFYEDFDLHVLEILQDNIETCEVHGVGLGIETEINKEIMESGPFMLFTFIIIIIILAVVFRHNPKSFLAGAIGMPMIIIWMFGTGRVLGLAQTQFNAFLPVLIMALGVDYAIHSMKRFEEELVKGKSPRDAVRGSTLKLTGTLALAMLTTFVAFFSNILSTIPALSDWGLEAALSIVWTFIIMGIFVPALRLGFESKAYRDLSFKHRLKADKKKAEKLRSKQDSLARNKLGKSLSRMTNASVARPVGVITVMLLLLVSLGYGAMNLGTDFEVEEFFDAESDFVVGLATYTDHFPEGGEPNIVLIERDIADPDVVVAIDSTRKLLDARGYATWYSPDISQIIVNFTENLMVNNMVSGNNMEITDANGDNIPDVRSEIEAIIGQVRTMGLYAMAGGNVYVSIRPGDLKEIIHYNEGKASYDKTVMAVGVSGSGSLDNIKQGMDNILADAGIIEDTGKAEVVVTGSGPMRYDQLTAISNSLFYSIIISIVVCFIILLIVFKKPGFSVVAIIPVILIAIWLYGIMFYTGFNLNVVTASIGAMSIGVGVDYSIHICDRFRKERAAGNKFNEAMDETIKNSGAALMFAALTTCFGFFVMLLAPMPMFFSFGLFSGMMVIFAFIASVIIVPPLIRLTERNKKK